MLRLAQDPLAPRLEISEDVGLFISRFSTEFLPTNSADWSVGAAVTKWASKTMAGEAKNFILNSLFLRRGECFV